MSLNENYVKKIKVHGRACQHCDFKTVQQIKYQYHAMPKILSAILANKSDHKCKMIINYKTKHTVAIHPF